MEKTKVIVTAGIFLILITFLSQSSLAQNANEEENYVIKGFELEKVILFFNACIATFLFILAFIAYKRDGRSRLLYVAIAFFLFAIKSFLVSSELFFPEIEWFDPLATVLEFGVLLSFFFGVLKR